MKLKHFKPLISLTCFIVVISVPSSSSEKNATDIADVWKSDVSSDSSKTPDLSPITISVDSLLKNSSNLVKEGVITSVTNVTSPEPMSVTKLPVLKADEKVEGSTEPKKSVPTKAKHLFLEPIIQELLRTPSEYRAYGNPPAIERQHIREKRRDLEKSQSVPVSKAVNPDKIVEELLEESRTRALTNDDLRTLQKYSYRIKKFVSLKPGAGKPPTSSESIPETETSDRGRWFWHWFGLGGDKKAPAGAPVTASNSQDPSVAHSHIIKPRVNPRPGQSYYEFPYPISSNTDFGIHDQKNQGPNKIKGGSWF